VHRRREVRPSPAMDVRVDETRNHGRRTEISVWRPRWGTGTDRSYVAAGYLNPTGPQQLSARQQRLGSD